MSRVLVTGATGFVGRGVLAALGASGDETHVVSRYPPVPDLAADADRAVSWHRADFLDRTAARRVVAEIGAEKLVHLAWSVPPGRFWTAHENQEWVKASMSVLSAFRAAGGRRAVLAGSCAEYTWGGDEDLDEDASPLRSRTLYGTCKNALRDLAGAYAEKFGLELAWGRLFFLYGPHEDPARLVPSVIRGLLARERVATTAGSQVRDFMHVEDVGRALVALLNSVVTGPVNIASGQGVPVGSVLDVLGAQLSAPELIDRGARPAPDSEPPRIVARVERLTREVGFTPALSLEDGLATTVAWWREQL